MYVLVTNQISNGTIYVSVYTFVPLYCAQKYGEHITPFMAAIIIGVFEVATILSAKIHALTIHLMGRKNAIILAYGLFTVSMICIGLLDML